MFLQSNDNEITDDKRRDKIIEFLKYNQGCSKEDVVKEVSNVMSKKTVYKTLDKLINEKVVRQEKLKPNSRSYKLFVDSENLIIKIPDELKQFEKYFIELVDKIYKIELEDNSNNKIETIKVNILLKELFPEYMFSMLVQSCILLSVYHWPKQIKNKENLKKLISEVFTLISSILVSLNNLISKEKLRNNELKNDDLVFSLADPRNLNTRIDKIITYSGLCQQYGLKKEYEKLLYIIWRINKDVQHIMYRKLMKYEQNYNFDKHYWLDLVTRHGLWDIEFKKDLSK